MEVVTNNIPVRAKSYIYSNKVWIQIIYDITQFWIENPTKDFQAKLYTVFRNKLRI